MFGILSIILLLSVVALIGVVIADASKQSPDLLSMRNLFIAGLIVFQFTSGVIAFLLPDETNPYAISDRMIPAVKYTIILLLFTAGFLFVYRSGIVANRVVGLINKRPVYATWPKLLVLSLAFFVVGVLCRLLYSHVPYFGTFLFMFGAAFLSLATGLAAWAWAPRIWNPIPLLVTSIVVLGGMAVLFTDSFGRRDMLGIVIAFVWGAYYSSWRYSSFKKVVLRFAVFGVVGIIFLGAYTSTRYSFGVQIVSLGDRVKALASADMKKGVADLFSGQNAATYSMYFLSTRPEYHEYDTLHSMRLLITLPIPRSMWLGKPDALALTSVQEINDAGKPKGWNIGPGLVGHIANDNPFLALPLYTLALAIFFRVCDGLLQKFSHDPFVVLSMGVALGQVIAIPRGELGNFFGKTMLYLFGGWVAMQVMARIVQLFSPDSSMLMPDEDEDWEGYEPQENQYADYADYDSQEQHDSAYPYS